MSYVTTDKHGGSFTHYSSVKSKEVVGTGNTWWPDFGPGIRDHSYQEKYAPHHHIFEKVVKPHTVVRTRSEPAPISTQFRHPAPAREAMLHKADPTREEHLAAHEFFQKQASLRRLEARQRRMDKWLDTAPIRLTAPDNSKAAMRALAMQDSKAAARSRSETSLSSEACGEASREVYERLGYLVGRSKGAPADGQKGARQRRHNPLSFNALMFGGGMVDSKRSRGPRKPSKQWRMLPESGFVFDPKTSLPVPRGGWDAQPPTSWPEPQGLGHREWAAPVTIDARPMAALGGTGSFLATSEARVEYQRSPSATDRGVVAGQAGSAVPKLAYSTGALGSLHGTQSFSATSGSLQGATETQSSLAMPQNG